MDKEEARRRVRVAVKGEMGRRGWNITQLHEVSGLDKSTLGDFLDGKRWPQIKTLGALEQAFEWPGGSLSVVYEGGPIPDVGGATDDEPDEEEDTLLYRRPEGLNDQEWDQLKRETRGFIEWQIHRAAQER